MGYDLLRGRAYWMLIGGLHPDIMPDSGLQVKSVTIRTTVEEQTRKSERELLKSKSE